MSNKDSLGKSFGYSMLKGLLLVIGLLILVAGAIGSLIAWLVGRL